MVNNNLNLDIGLLLNNHPIHRQQRQHQINTNQSPNKPDQLHTHIIPNIITHTSPATAHTLHAGSHTSHTTTHTDTQIHKMTQLTGIILRLSQILCDSPDHLPLN